jgi:hypothetical protein
VTARVPCLILEEGSGEADSMPWAQHDVQAIRDLETNAIDGQPCFRQAVAASMLTARGDGDIMVRAVRNSLARCSAWFPPMLPRELRAATAWRKSIYAIMRPASGAAFVAKK